MKGFGRPSVGLIGRIFAILLIAIAFEFAISTLFYERVGDLRIQEDEAHRVAEHLVIARHLLAGRPREERYALAAQLSSERLVIGWYPDRHAPVASGTGELQQMREQMIRWEPELAAADLRLHLVSARHGGTVRGGVRLPDRTWLTMRTTGLIDSQIITVKRILTGLAPALGLVVIAGLLVRHTLRPLRMLATAAERVGRGGWLQLPEIGASEVRHLIAAFNAMQARIRQLISDRTQALAAVSHDLRTPLARLQLRAESIEDPALRRSITNDVAEMEAMLSSVLAYLGGDSDPEAAVRVDIAVLLATLVDDAADHGRQVTYEGPDHLEAVVRPLGLKRAVANLVDNALHYGIRAWLSVESADGFIRINVDDDGPGIPVEHLETVLSPFTRLDHARARNTKGLGLGLAIAAAAAKAEDGMLRLTNRANGGLRAQISIPHRQ